jgi:hypothetical protein
MPLKRCSKDNKSGWKYGDSGHCYTGPGAKKKAIKQGVAEQYNGGEKVSKAELTKFLANEGLTPAEMMEFDLSDLNLNIVD